MKHALVFLALIISQPSPAIPQSRVDAVVNALDSLASLKYSNWRVSPDLRTFRSGDTSATQSGFDDSGWGTLKLNESIYPDSCWLRKEITLPEKFLGQPVRGRVKFLVSVDDYGYLWVNGRSRGFFPWDGEFELTADAKPGERFLLVIKAINTGGPLRLLRAELQPEQTSEMRKTVEDFSLGLRVGQKLLGFDTYQTNAHKKSDPHIDRSAIDRSEKARLDTLLQRTASRIDVDALGAGAMDRFTASLNSAHNELKPVADFVRKFTLFFDANAHIDAAWLWRDLETKEVVHNTFASVLSLMDERRDFTYTQSAAQYYKWMEDQYPDLFRSMQQRVKDGRWEIVGGMWIEPDCNLPGGESWMHHLLYSQRYFQSRFGTGATIGYNPDSFGYNWNMPEFYAAAGIDVFVTQKMGWSETNVFPYRAFWWESPDGSKILNVFPFDYVYTVDDPFRTADWLRQFEANTGLRNMLVLFGVGDHGGGPSKEMIERIERLKTIDLFPKIEYGTITQYLERLRGEYDLSKLPVWKDEIYLEYHQGCYTTQAETKAWNRRSEVALTNAEKFSTIASMYGRAYHSSDLEEAWDNVLFNQFHDILPGSGIRENYIDADEKYRASEVITNFETDGSLEAITRQINTSGIGSGIPVIVFNSLSWERRDLARFALAAGDTGTYAVYDGGKEIPSQIVGSGRYQRDVLFIADHVPSLGYKVFELRKRRPGAFPPKFTLSASSIENADFRIAVDPDSGWIRSIIDKRMPGSAPREILTGYGNELQLLEDKPRAWDAWNVGLTGVKYPSRLRKIEIVENGPVRATIRLTRDYLKPGVKKDDPTPRYPSSFFTQDISLYDGVPRIDFTTGVDWWEDKTMLKVAFPVAVKDTAATYEIPYGTIRRSTGWRSSWDSAKVEVPAERWADLSETGYGISLLNRSKYGYDIKDGVMRLSLLRSPKWPDPDADRGKHTIEYALYPHTGDWQSGKTVRAGYEYNSPLLAVRGVVRKGKLPASQSFVKLSPENLVLTVVKKAEEDGAWVIQWYDAGGKDTDALLTLPRTPGKVIRSNFLEKDVAPVKFAGPEITVHTPHNSVVTVKVYFR